MPEGGERHGDSGRSLVHGGFLCLGSKESLLLSGHGSAYDEVAPGSRIFRKRVGPARLR